MLRAGAHDCGSIYKQRDSLTLCLHSRNRDTRETADQEDRYQCRHRICRQHSTLAHGVALRQIHVYLPRKECNLSTRRCQVTQVHSKVTIVTSRKSMVTSQADAFGSVDRQTHRSLVESSRRSAHPVRLPPTKASLMPACSVSCLF